MEDKIYWIWLSLIGIGDRKLEKLLEKYKKVENIWNAKEKELIYIEGIGQNLTNKMLKREYKEKAKRYLEKLEEKNIQAITLQDTYYPDKLKTIFGKPIVLYVKGKKDILNEFSLAIVGCRECSQYGKNTAIEIAHTLSNNQVNIVSGLARGIDAYAHQGALMGKEKTIAVLGCGVDIIYPKENEKLYNEILQKEGAIVSEYIIETEPERMHFPARNRLISGLSDGVIVIEAKEKSGSLITVDFALEQGKNVFVVPGNINSPYSKGTNDLIKQGAKPITCLKDILEEYIV